MEYLLLALVIVSVPFVLPIALWVAVSRIRTRISRLERLIDDQRATVDRLVDAVATRQPASAGPVPAAGVPPLAAEPRVPAPPSPPREVAVPVSLTATEQAPELPAHDLPPEGGSHQVILRSAPPPVRLPDAPPFDWENLIGVKLFSAIAGIALVLAAVFFLRYSVQQDWLQPPVRIFIGVVVALGLLIVCERKAARQYPATANALDAAAVAILFATFFAAYALWDLVPAIVAFGLLAAVTALAVLLSIRRESLFIAVLGLLGGFATPALLSTGENRPVPLFAYLVLLNVGLAWVAYRQVWPALTILTVVLTSAYQWVWVFRFLSAGELPLALGIFAVFPVVSVAALFLLGQPRGVTPRGREGDTFERTAIVSAALPLAFVLYLSAVPAFGARPGLLFGFLLLVDAGLLAIAATLSRPTLHVAGALVTLLVWAAWLTTGYESGARELALGFTAAFVALYLVGPSLPARVSPSGGRADLALYAAPAMLFVFPVIAAIDPDVATAWRLFAPLLVLVLLCAWRAHVLARGTVFFIASFLAVAAQAVWSAVHLVPERLGTAVSGYAVFGLMLLSVPMLARRAGRPLQPETGGAVVLIASLGLLLFLSQGSIAPAALWALALLLAVLNAGIFIESASSRVPLLAQIGSVLSWILLAAWWAAAGGAVGILPSLAVLTGLTLVTLAGHVWAGRTARRAETAAAGAGSAVFPERVGRGPSLALTGHLFLLAVAFNREWALPPWPMFGALLVMTMGTAAAALSVGSRALHVAGVGGAALVIAAWTAAAGVMPWTLTGLAASAVLSILALGLAATGARRHPGVREAALVALFGSGVTAIFASAAQGPPPFAAMLGIHLASLGAVLALATRAGWPRVAIAAVVMAWAALLEWQVGHALAVEWRQLLLLAVAVYVLFTVYPLMAGSRMPDRREPWVAALLAAAMTFLAGRQALTAGGLGWLIGALPLAQGLVTAGLLRALLRLQPPGARDLTRLALVAGVALAFVTVAIPLQLQHQWITIGWALEGAALAWLYSRVRHRGLLVACVSLLTIVFIRLALNPSVWTYEPRGAMRIFNWYLYTYAVAAAAMLLSAWYLSATRDRLAAALPRASQLLPAGAVILLFLLLNIQIADYYATGPEILFRFGSTLSQDLTYTIAWLAFGMVLLAAGILSGSRPARIAAVALIAMTTFKCFLYDLGSLEGLHRVASFVGLAAALALVSLALQKYVLARPRTS